MKRNKRIVLAKAALPHDENPAEEIFSTAEYSDDPIAFFSRTLAQYPVLDRKEQDALFRRYHRARRKYGMNAKRTLAVRNEIALHNLRIPVQFARRYEGRGIDVSDLLQVGFIGLTRAVEKYEFGFGASFYTYGHRWVWQAVMRTIATQARTIRLPTHLQEKRKKVIGVINAWFEKNPRWPEPEEIVRLLKGAVTLESVRNILASFRFADPVSLQSAASHAEDGEGFTLAEVIADPAVGSPSEELEQKHSLRRVREALRMMPDRWREVLEYRFGIQNGGQPLTLEEVGRKYKVTRERIRQIEAKGLAFLRHPNRLRFLHGERDKRLPFVNGKVKGNGV